MQIIKEYKVIIAATLIAAAILLKENNEQLQYLSLGKATYATFKDGELHNFCDIDLDFCFQRSGSTFFGYSMNIKELINKVEYDAWQKHEQGNQPH